MGITSRNVSLVTRLAVCFAVPVFLLAALGLLGERASSRINGNVQSVSTLRLPIIVNLLEADRDLHQALVAERTLILGRVTGEPAAKLRAAIVENIAQADERVGKASALADTPEERRLVQAFERERTTWRASSARMLQHIDARDFAAAQALSLGELATGFDAMREHVNKLEEVSERLATAAGDDAQAVFARTRMVLLVVTVLGLIMSIALAWAVSRWVARRVGHSAETISGNTDAIVSAAAELATTSQQMSTGATSQAASLEETSASMEQLSAMTRQNAEHTGVAATTVAETERLVGQANAALQAMAESMSAIVESSVQVGRINKSIDEIAFQTNILALNAAVEAARAGEAGLGFAVVADEVRALAQRAAQAARETTSLIDEAVRRATEGRGRADAVSAVISAITDSTARVKALVDDVSSGSRQQSQGLQQIAQAISSMEQVTQSNAASAEQAAAASEELHANAEQAQRTLLELAALLGGHSATAADPLPAPPQSKPVVRRPRAA